MHYRDISQFNNTRGTANAAMQVLCLICCLAQPNLGFHKPQLTKPPRGAARQEQPTTSDVVALSQARCHRASRRMPHRPFQHVRRQPTSLRIAYFSAYNHSYKKMSLLAGSPIVCSGEDRKLSLVALRRVSRAAPMRIQTPKRGACQFC